MTNRLGYAMAQVVHCQSGAGVSLGRTALHLGQIVGIEYSKLTYH